jgi:hypothetical protein
MEYSKAKSKRNILISDHSNIEIIKFLKIYLDSVQYLPANWTISYMK